MVMSAEERRTKKNERQREYAKRTGYASNKKYNAKTYTTMIVSVKKEKAALYKEKCKALDVPYSYPLIIAMEKILKK